VVYEPPEEAHLQSRGKRGSEDEGALSIRKGPISREGKSEKTSIQGCFGGDQKFVRRNGTGGVKAANKGEGTFGESNGRAMGRNGTVLRSTNVGVGFGGMGLIDECSQGTFGGEGGRNREKFREDGESGKK